MTGGYDMDLIIRELNIPNEGDVLIRRKEQNEVIRLRGGFYKHIIGEVELNKLILKIRDISGK